jgi:hypothetical protein
MIYFGKVPALGTLSAKTDATGVTKNEPAQNAVANIMFLFIVIQTPLKLSVVPAITEHILVILKAGIYVEKPSRLYIRF